MAHDDHRDDYSDLLSAEERAEIEAKRQERSPLNEPQEPPAPSMATKNMQDVLAALVKPFKPYRRYHELGSAPSPNRENDAGGFLKESRDYVFDPATLKRLMGSASPIPHFVVGPSPAAVPQFGGIGSLPPPVGGVAEASLAGVNLPADDLQRLLPLIRQIAREEITRFHDEQRAEIKQAIRTHQIDAYQRSRRPGGHHGHDGY